MHAIGMDRKVRVNAAPSGLTVAKWVDPQYECKVTGIFHVKAIRDRDTGRVVSLFQLDAQRIEPDETVDVPTPDWVKCVRCVSGIGIYTIFLLMARERRFGANWRRCGRASHAVPFLFVSSFELRHSSLI
jgi:hypothetical protein